VFQGYENGTRLVAMRIETQYWKAALMTRSFHRKALEWLDFNDGRFSLQCGRDFRP